MQKKFQATLIFSFSWCLQFKYLPCSVSDWFSKTLSFHIAFTYAEEGALETITQILFCLHMLVKP